MKVLVVGAGPAGLAIAFGLAERGVEVVVIEGGDVGGRVRTLERDGYRVELGPAGILDDAPDTHALLRALGADAPRVIAADPVVKRRYVVRDGRVRALPTGPVSLLFGSTLTWGERLALLRERGVPAASTPEESVADFVRRRFGESLATAFAQPIVVGVFGGDYEALELKSAFPRLAALEREHGSVVRGLSAEAGARRRAGEPRPALITFAGGMGALPLALAARLGSRLRVGARAVSISTAEQASASDSSLRSALTVRLANGEAIAADRVVLAGAPDASAALLGSLDPALQDRLAEISFAAIVSVSFGWRRADVPHPLDGFGLLVPRTAGMKIIGVLFMSSIFPEAHASPEGEVLLRVMLGGPSDPQIDTLDDAALLGAAREELGRLLGIHAAPRFSHLQRWPKAIPQYTRGHAARAAEIDARARTHGLFVAGTALHGVGVNDVIRDAARLVGELCR